MEDPIFDPWCLGDESSPTPPQRTSRWRSAVGSGQGVPASRPVPSPIVPSAADSDERSTFVPGTIGKEGDKSDALTVAEEGQVPLPSASEPTPAEEPVSQSDRPNSTPLEPEVVHVDRRQLDDAAEFEAAAASLRALLLPRIETITQRLKIARHRTTVDDRLGQDPATLRFRIVPWAGPFDDAVGGREAVLEVVLEGARADRVAGRLWLDPLSRSPSEQTSVAGEKVTAMWVDGLLLDFVEKALRQA